MAVPSSPLCALPPDVLEHIQTLYPTEASPGNPSEAYIANPWYLVAAVAANAANEPEAVPIVFLAALHGLQAIQSVTGVAGDAAREQRLQLARKIREGVLQSGVLCGFPKVRMPNASVSVNLYLSNTLTPA